MIPVFPDKSCRSLPVYGLILQQINHVRKFMSIGDISLRAMATRYMLIDSTKTFANDLGTGGNNQEGRWIALVNEVAQLYSLVTGYDCQ